MNDVINDGLISHGNEHTATGQTDINKDKINEGKIKKETDVKGGK